MLKKILKIFLILLFFLIACYKIYNSENSRIDNHLKKLKIKNSEEIIEEEKLIEKSIGKIIIKKINLEKQLYNIESSENNVNKNITILKGSIEPSEHNSIMFIAAHSGTGKLAYFKDLDKLEKNDQIQLFYKNKNYYYQVTNKWETKKDGDIEITKSEGKQLILTTCSPTNKDKQLIINCIEKES